MLLLYELYFLRFYCVHHIVFIFHEASSEYILGLYCLLFGMALSLAHY